MATRVRSFCKINLGLAVGPARADGFHALTTLYQTMGLHEFLTVTAHRAEKTAITLAATRDGAQARGVPQTVHGDAEKNTAWRMVAGALKRFGISAEVHIEIEKRLPVQGGLGGGSANAVAALLGLERELGVALSAEERLELAAEVGSDVPLFLLGGSVLGTGRGEVVRPMPDVAGDGVAVAAVIAVPSVGVSTRAAFAELDRRFGPQGPLLKSGQNGGAEVPPLQNSDSLTSGAIVDKVEELSRVLAAAFGGSFPNGPSGIPGMTRPPDADKSLETKSMHGDLAENPLLMLVRTGIENDFEEAAFSQHPFLRDIKRELVGEGPGRAVYAALSGSGSALFGLYSSPADAAEAQQRVQRAGTVALLTETLPRKAYWEQMFVD